VWKRILWRPVTAKVATMYGAVSAAQWIRDTLLPAQYQERWQQVLRVLPRFAWQTWALIALVLLIGLVLEGAYAELAAVEREREANDRQRKRKATTAELEAQSQLLITKRLLELNDARTRNDADVENDHLRRNVSRGGMVIGALITTNGKLLLGHAESFVQDHVGLVRDHSELTDETGAWIERKLEAHMQGVARGLTTKITKRAGGDVPAEHIKETVERVTNIAWSRARLNLTQAIGEARLRTRSLNGV
jgi:hypothetical protein